MMENRNGKTHNVVARAGRYGNSLTMGKDVETSAQIMTLHYLANMAYADYMGKSLKEDADCLQWAVDFLEDPWRICRRRSTIG